MALHMKLGLLAMSGVRAARRGAHRARSDAARLRRAQQLIASLPSLGLLTLAGMTPDEVDITYIEVADIRMRRPAGRVRRGGNLELQRADKEAYELADRYRAAGTKVIIGGLHVTALPEEARARRRRLPRRGRALWPRDRRRLRGRGAPR